MLQLIRKHNLNASHFIQRLSNSKNKLWHQRHERVMASTIRPSEHKRVATPKEQANGE